MAKSQTPNQHWARFAAIEAASRKNIFLIGFDVQPEVLTTIQNGIIFVADIAQYPRKIAQLTIETIAKYLSKETVPALVPVEVEIIDRTVLEQKSKEIRPEYWEYMVYVH